MTKIAFRLMGDPNWSFGTIYFKDLLYALRKTFGASLTCCFLVYDDNQPIPDDLCQAVNEILTYTPPRKWDRLWAMNKVAGPLIRRDLALESFLKQHAVSVVAFGPAPLETRVPYISLIPDFQHIHLPDMFSVRERQIRDRSYMDIARRSARIVTLSESAKSDFRMFAPEWIGKVRALSPVSVIPNSVYETDPMTIVEHYHLPSRFIFLPNQFWKHKNHRVVFHALKALKEKGTEVFLVCSGFPGDYRHLRYFADLLQELALLDIRNQVALLGVLPRDHVLQLMRQSVCVLNPSLFEGFGMAVDEAKNLGKPMILSDIPSHREQNPPGAIFFDPSDWTDLAGKLASVWIEKSAGVNPALETDARAALSLRITKYAESFMAVVREVALD